MIVVHIITSLALAGIIYTNRILLDLDIWYPWGVFFHLLALFTTERVGKFICVFLINVILTIAVTTMLLVKGNMTLLLGMVILLNIIMLFSQWYFRVFGTRHKMLIIICTFLILPAGYNEQIAVGNPTAFSVTATGWYRPTTEVNKDLPNVHRRLISQCSMPMRENDPGTINAKVAAQYINHKIIRQGETFSFNKTVGPRTKERGFVPSSSFIVNALGETVSVPDIGGGICRTATLLNNAITEARISVIEQHCHSASVRYASPGEDTAVAWPELDYKFANDLYHVIEILAEYKKDQLFIELWGF